MAGDFLPVLSTLVPLAVVVAISPLAIVSAVLLVLHSKRPKSTGLAYLIGWLAGLTTVSAVFVALPQVFSGLDHPLPRWVTWVRLALGLALIAFGIWRWFTRARATPSKLSASIAHVPPGGALALGFGLTIVNPKILLVSAAAGFAIGTAPLSAPLTWLSVAAYTMIGGSTAIVPIVAYLIAADRLAVRLDVAKKWIERREAPLTAVVMVLVGGVLILTGLAAL